MSKNKEYLIDLLFQKLKKHSSRKINLEKKELTEFINSLIKDNK